MIPLETLDQYMTLVVALGGVYLIFMLFLLACFLRKFNSEPVDSLICQRPIELRTISNPYRYSNVNQNVTRPPSYTSRSNRSYSSRNSSNVCKIQMKKIAYGRIDLSQMERLATLWFLSVIFAILLLYLAWTWANVNIKELFTISDVIFYPRWIKINYLKENRYCTISQMNIKYYNCCACIKNLFRYYDLIIVNLVFEVCFSAVTCLNWFDAAL